jgi:predicted ribonuclease YlaK
MLHDLGYNGNGSLSKGVRIGRGMGFLMIDTSLVSARDTLGLKQTPDNQILIIAQKWMDSEFCRSNHVSVSVMTGDIALSVKAWTLGIAAEDYCEDGEEMDFMPNLRCNKFSADRLPRRFKAPSLHAQQKLKRPKSTERKKRRR